MCGMAAMEPPAYSPVLAALCGPRSTEERWLRFACTFAEEWLFSRGPREPEDTRKFREGVIRCLAGARKEEEEEEVGEGRQQGLPVSYSFISVSELRSQQRSPCCSHVSWSTEQHHQWARQAEALLPNQKALPRARLILIGYLTDRACRTGGGPEERAGRVDGNLYVRDDRSAMPCEMLHFSLDFLEQLLLFPGWSYLPASGGYLEILVPPVPVFPRPERGLAGDEQPVAVLYPRAAARLLRSRSAGKIPCLNVAGELLRYSSLLDIRGRVFFTLFLKCFSTDVCIPVMVQDPAKVSWHFSLSVGSRYVITGLLASAVQGSRRRLLQASASSELLPFSEGRVREQELLPQALLKQHPAPAEAEVGPSRGESAPGIRLSKVLSYKGIVTKVLNARAGLYEVDGSVCLCVAYQQLVNCGRGLRPGAHVEIQDVHFLQRPSPHFPLVVLCCCLQSVILVRDFSSLSSAHEPFHTPGNLYVSLLLKHHLDLPRYLWVVKTVEALRAKFCPHFIKPQRLEASVRNSAPGIAEKVLVPILGSLAPPAYGRRDVEEEIVAERHRCPLAKYSALKDPCEVPSLSRLYADAERQGWERLCLAQLLPSNQAQYMNAKELNRGLAWSCHKLGAQDFQPPCVLVGVLRSCPRSGSLQLQDESRSVPCLVVEKPPARRGQVPETGHTGSVLQVDRFQIVVERFIRSDFPSWKQLASPEHVREKHSRVYVQFRMEDVVVLGPSEAARRVPRCPGEDEPQPPAAGVQAEAGGGTGQPSKRPAGPAPGAARGAKAARLAAAGEATGPGGGGPSGDRGREAVSRLFLLVQKEGLLPRYCAPAREEGAGGGGPRLQLSFQALAAWVGKPRAWAEPGEVQEAPEVADGDWEGQSEPQRVSDWDGTRPRTFPPLSLFPFLTLPSSPAFQVMLLFAGKTVRWFPFLQPDCLYRLIAPRCSDTGVFERLSAPPIPVRVLHLSSCSLHLPVPENWKLRSETRQGSPTQRQDLYRALAGVRPELHSIAEILQPNFAGSLVSFAGEISERVLCEPDRKGRIPASLREGEAFLPWEYGLRLSVRDPSRSTLHVYMNVSNVPYPLGLLPGAGVLFYNLERKTSRMNNVYCKLVPCSCLSVTELPSRPALRSAALDSASPPAFSPPPLFLSQLVLQPEGLSQGRSVCHVVCVLGLGLHWLCSLCGSVFSKGSCSRSAPACTSQTRIFQAYAKIIVEDGSAEARVVCRNHQVCALLRLSRPDWEGLQQHVLREGHVYVHHRGWSVEHKYAEEPDGELLPRYLRKLCLSSLICRPVLLSFRLYRREDRVSPAEAVEVRTFGLGRHEYSTRVPGPLSLMCLELGEVDYRVLCHLSGSRIRAASEGFAFMQTSR
ncbi:CST complex subunit CTC1 isoform X2 [Rhinatrema bivittatum]|uniref:CST complex subunit CTC1 isoform X2 n=1 Tax=Rhinatrema bivittatum TaxID=194408 RepID=UPI00112BEA70|nr:CST complex subunit CTC1 isoform X2 [Rhinatrema bivittatum]